MGRAMLTPTLPMYDSAFFPPDPVTGQLVRDVNDPSTLWVYGIDGNWHQIGGTPLPPPAPGIWALPHTSDQPRKGIARFPGGIITISPARMGSSGIPDFTFGDATVDQDMSGPSTPASINPTDDVVLVSTQTGGVVSASTNQLPAGVTPVVSFLPEHVGLLSGHKYDMFIGYRAHPASTGAWLAAKSDDYIASSLMGTHVITHAGYAGANSGLWGSTNYGYQGMGYGGFGSYGPIYHDGNQIDIYAWCNGGTAWIAIDWIMFMPDSGYYFYAGQGGPAPQRSRPQPYPYATTDESGYIQDAYCYDTQVRGRFIDVVMSDADQGVNNAPIWRPGFTYAVYLTARSFTTGWDYTTGSRGVGIVSWLQNSGHSADCMTQSFGAWVPMYMGMHTINQNDYGVALWTPDGSSVNFPSWYNAGDPRASTEIRLQRIMFMPLKGNNALESVGTRPPIVPWF